MSFMRFLGSRGEAAGPLPMEAETEAVRQIVTRLEALPPEQARMLAGMAYVLARAANSDLQISDVETATIEGELVGAGLDQSQAVLVTEMAKLQELASGGTSDYLVTRDFRQASTPEQRLAVLRGCYLVAAADGAITSMEMATLDEIASELDIERPAVNEIRRGFVDRITARIGFGAGDGAAQAPTGDAASEEQATEASSGGGGEEPPA